MLVLPKDTVEDIDRYLTGISNIIKYGVRTDKIKAFRKADEFLDRRLKIMKKNGGE